MKTKNSLQFVSLSLSLLLATGLYNCTPQKSEPEIPKFDEEYKNVKLPEITIVKPAEVVLVPGKVEEPKAVTSLSAELTAGTVTPAITAAATDMEKIVSADKAAEINAAFTDDVINKLAKGEPIPASLKASIDAIAANPAFAAYLPSLTLPTVNGKPVTGIVKELPFKNNQPLFTVPDYAIAAINSPCTDSAQAAFNRAKAVIDNARIQQRANVTNSYNQNVASINNTECFSTFQTTIVSSIATSLNVFNTRLVLINKITTPTSRIKSPANTLANPEAQLVKTLFIVNFTTQINSFNRLSVVSSSACDTEKTEKLRAAEIARDTNFVTVENNYKTALANLQATLTKSFQTCHDQGQG
ncbi:hypothetical protein [Emticicia fluvialis]|uniref:hypothetical protein n=1 Tax=Emticicia fluvialis TaxID=2974474 RepID=UPI002166969F|nr:hypothetical protein [Emticicia fluvialis]